MIELGLTLVKVGDRRREDYGDIDQLAASIAEHGLLHPIVVDADDNLVAGGRRLRAVEQLGWLSIPVTRLGDLTETQLREVELEENLRRKDLTTEERDRDLLALVDTVSGTFADSPRISNGGRPTEPTSTRQVAERIGRDESTIRAARDHVAAIDRYPEVRQAVAVGASRKDVVTIAKNLVPAGALVDLGAVVRGGCRVGTAVAGMKIPRFHRCTCEHLGQAHRDDGSCARCTCPKYQRHTYRLPDAAGSTGRKVRVYSQPTRDSRA